MSTKSLGDDRSPSRQEFEQEVLRRVGSDPAFRQQLVADPKAALQAAFDIELPPGVEIQVLEETPSRFYLVLPIQTAELSDEQLASVAGGVGAQPTLAATTAAFSPAATGYDKIGTFR